MASFTLDFLVKQEKYKEQANLKYLNLLNAVEVLFYPNLNWHAFDFYL